MEEEILPSRLLALCENVGFYLVCQTLSFVFDKQHLRYIILCQSSGVFLEMYETIDDVYFNTKGKLGLQITIEF